MRAFVTGANGQDGSYLCELLLEKDFDVVGLVRRSSQPNQGNLKKCFTYPKFRTVEGDITDGAFISGVIANGNFDEVYNLAAQSHVGTSFKNPSYTFDVNAGGFINILEAVRLHSPLTKVYQASTSECFGSNINSNGTQSENTVMVPNSPYAAAKVAAHHTARIYRESYGLYVSCGILFNHESPRRGLNFVTMKVCDYVARIIASQTNNASLFLSTNPKLELHNLYSYRDWGDARDYVKAMYAIIQHNDDFVVATGVTRSITDLLNTAFHYASIQDWTPYVKLNKENARPLEVPRLCGDATKVRSVTGWQPIISFDQMIGDMIKERVKYYSGH